MQITAYLPLEVAVTSYHPADPGHVSGLPEDCYPPEPAEIEFEVRLRTGHELSASDFGEDAWNGLCDAVLETYEDSLEEARADAAISAYEDRLAADFWP